METTGGGDCSPQFFQGQDIGKATFDNVEYDGDIYNGDESSNDERGKGLHVSNADKSEVVAHSNASRQNHDYENFQLDRVRAPVYLHSCTGCSTSSD